MTTLFRAEWLKITGNRWAVTFLVWIFPIGALLMMSISLLISLASPEAQESGRQFLTTWQGAFLSTWEIPNTNVGRFAIVVFTAIIFAGEYQQGTWKNIITRRQRWVIMLNKFFTLGVFITFAFTLLSVIIGIGSVLLGQIVGHNMGVFDMEYLMTFLGDLAPQMGLTFLGTFIAAGYAMLGAMYSRHVMATVVIGMTATVGESVMIVVVTLFRSLLDIDIYSIYTLTPTYQITNILFNVEEMYQYLAPPDFVNFSPSTSWMILVAWVVILVSFSTWLFTRQDITN